VGVTFSVGNRHFTAFTSHIGPRSVRIVTQAGIPPDGTRIVVRLPIPRGGGYHIVRISGGTSDMEEGLSGQAGAFGVPIQAIDESEAIGVFRSFVQRLAERRPAASPA